MSSQGLHHIHIAQGRANARTDEESLLIVPSSRRRTDCCHPAITASALWTTGAVFLGLAVWQSVTSHCSQKDSSHSSTHNSKDHTQLCNLLGLLITSGLAATGIVFWYFAAKFTWRARDANFDINQ